MSKLSEIKPGATIKLDKQRTLRFTLNSLALVEERYGDMQKAAELAQSGKISVIRTLLWAGLVHEDNALSEEQVGDMVDMTNLETVVKAIEQAFLTAPPEQEGKN